MSTEAPDDPFAPQHIRYVIDKNTNYKFEPVPYLNKIGLFAHDNCTAKMVGIYCYALQEGCSLRGFSDINVLIYPGSICEINGQDRVFAVSGRTIYCPGKVYENCNNPKAYQDVVVVANFLQCLLSVDRIKQGKAWAPHKDVIALAKNIFGKDRAEDIKFYYRFVENGGDEKKEEKKGSDEKKGESLIGRASTHFLKVSNWLARMRVWC